MLFRSGTRNHQLAAAVIAEAPFRIRIVEPKSPLVQSGTAKLRVTVERRTGFEEAINLKMLWNPPGVGSDNEVTIPKGAAGADYNLNATAEAATKKWRIAILGTANYKGGPVWASTQLATLEVAPPFLFAKIQPAQGEPGKASQIIAKLEQKIPFEGKAKVKLMGLPDKVTAPEREISKADQEIVFPLSVDASVSPGSHKQLFCSVTFKKGEIGRAHV